MKPEATKAEILAEMQRLRAEHEQIWRKAKELGTARWTFPPSGIDSSN